MNKETPENTYIYKKNTAESAIFDGKSRISELLKNEIQPQNSLKEYESEDVQKTLDGKYVPAVILEARDIQDKILKTRFKGKKLRIADIGCGNGYHGNEFAPDCECYDGYEISREMARRTRSIWQQNKLTTARVIEADAANVNLDPESYDIAWSLYFTSGNFRDEMCIGEYTEEYLNKNPKFIAIVKKFYKALVPGGKLFLTVYKDTPETEAAQREFYKNTGQTVITPIGRRFVATKENFWSVRWTKESMLSNLSECGINPDQVIFNDLNEIGWLVEITKPVSEKFELMAA